MPFFSRVCFTPLQSLLVAEQDENIMAITDTDSKMNNSFFISFN